MNHINVIFRFSIRDSLGFVEWSVSLGFFLKNENLAPFCKKWQYFGLGFALVSVISFGGLGFELGLEYRNLCWWWPQFGLDRGI